MNAAWMPSLLFYLFAAALLGSGLVVILVRQMVTAALALVFAFFNAACLWLLLRAEFLAIALILVYVGAVMVLFLFVVMTLDVDATPRQALRRTLPAALITAMVILLEMGAAIHAATLTPQVLVTASAAVSDAATHGNTHALGMLLFSDYRYPLQIAGLILLAAMVAAIVLTLRRRSDFHYIEAADQVSVASAERVRIVQVSASPKEGAAW